MTGRSDLRRRTRSRPERRRILVVTEGVKTEPQYVDSHNLMSEAVATARREVIKVAVSNPCFELWLFWHFADLFAATSAIELCHRLRQHGVGGKDVPPTFCYANHLEAARRAVASCPTDPYALPNNPGTSVHRLTGLIVGSP